MSPLELLQTALDNIGPYLPWPVRTVLSMGIKSISSLPPSLANVLPILLSLFALYSAVMTAYSTARYALRTVWFFAKCGAFIGGITYLFGGGDYVAQTATGASGVFNRFANNYYGSPAQRRGASSWTDYAANVLSNGNADSFLGGRREPGILDYMQNPMRTIFSQVVNFANPAGNAAPASQRRRNTDDFESKWQQVEQAQTCTNCSA